MHKTRAISHILLQRLGKKRLFYVCRDVERAAAGLSLNLANFYIITNDSPYARELQKEYPRIILLKSKAMLDTREILESGAALQIDSGDHILVFKSTPQIEEICRRRKWKLLNPDALLASGVEEKISQIKWLGPLGKFLPPYKVDICENFEWTGTPFILQFNRSHTGSGTVLIKNAKQLNEIKSKFPKREARSAKYIVGPLFTNNIVVWGDKILHGNISYQITGLKPFTDRPFATIGNDWSLPGKILDAKQIGEYKKIGDAVGKRLEKFGWKGLFGIDVVLDEKTGRLYLLEINARQPASTTFESELQEKEKNKKEASLLTTFEAHLASLLGINADDFELIKIKDGAQIIQRIIDSRQPAIDKRELAELDIKVIKYNNKKMGDDFLRMQTQYGIMKKHNTFNKLGHKIKQAIQ